MQLEGAVDEKPRSHDNGPALSSVMIIKRLTSETHGASCSTARTVHSRALAAAAVSIKSGRRTKKKVSA